jgi:glycosyltransferase involved in cell wall biosynthesis
LRILITNYDLNLRGGTQLFVRDVAKKLLEWGHEPIVHSPTLGSVAGDLRGWTIPVTSDLRTITVAPDIIIGNYHLGTMAALHQFRESPAIFFCHGWNGRLAMPAKFPRIRRYVAVDETSRARLVYEHGIDSHLVEMILNSVDMDRFPARDSLPPRPRRAVLFGNEFEENDHLRAIRAACEEQGIKTDVMGSSLGKTEAEPEKLLGQYDLVFARARCALEAMATGAAVILAATSRMGRMVTTADIDRYRPLNFGYRTLTTPIDVDSVRREIARYDPADAAEVSRRIRQLASLDLATAEILRVAEEVVEEQQGTELDVEKEYLATAAYLGDLDGDYMPPVHRLRARLARWPIIGPLALRLAYRLVR